ncbi:MAG: hypothetical protein ABIN54_09145 [candidate division WOR-3 bacterium]
MISREWCEHHMPLVRIEQRPNYPDPYEEGISDCERQFRLELEKAQEANRTHICEYPIYDMESWFDVLADELYGAGHPSLRVYADALAESEVRRWINLLVLCQWDQARIQDTVELMLWRSKKQTK